MAGAYSAKKKILTSTLITLIFFMGTVLAALLQGGTTTTISTINQSMPGSVPTLKSIIALPSGFSGSEEYFQGNEIEYHLNIVAPGNKAKGYFQIFFMGTDPDNKKLQAYLENAERYKAADINTFKTYSGDRPQSIIWEYTTMESNVMYYFEKKGQHLYILMLSGNKTDISMEKLNEYFKELVGNIGITQSG